MRTFLKVLAVIGIGLLITIALALPAFWMPEDAADVYGVVFFVGPVIGCAIGGWLVSRRSGSHRMAWIIGGGLGLGLVVFVIEIALIGLLLSAALDGSVGYCC